jgi:hypothetical protein
MLDAVRAAGRDGYAHLLRADAAERFLALATRIDLTP